VVLGSAALAAALYVLGWMRLRRRGRADLASWARAAMFGAGLAACVVALLSPLDPMGEEYLLFGHMLQHVLLADVGPLLLVLGIMGPLALFVVPQPVLRTVARRRPLRATLRAATGPVVAVTLWILVMVGWHVPFAFEYALEHRWAHDLEHASMFAAGVLVWLTIAGAVPRRRLSHARRAAIAVGLLVVGMVLSQAIFLADPLYDVYVEQPERLFGLTPKGDQVRAAMLMSADQLLTLGTAAGVLLWAHVERTAGVEHDEAAAPEAVRES
jgi:putative membrane protein